MQSAQRQEPFEDLDWQSRSGTAAAATTASPNPNQRQFRDVERSRANLIVGGLTKRWFDITTASAAIILLLPLLCLIALAIKLSSAGSVLYRHRRVGANGATFDCLKFRTMAVNGDDVLQHHLAGEDRKSVV